MQNKNNVQIKTVFSHIFLSGGCLHSFADDLKRTGNQILNTRSQKHNK